jgi:uncharacterized protein YkwD
LEEREEGELDITRLNGKAEAMRTTRWLTGGLLVGLLLATGPTAAQKTKEHTSHSEASKRPALAPPGSRPNLERVKQLIVSATNQFRRQEGRGALRVNENLTRAAQSFADYLAASDKFSHTADGKEPWERVAEAGYEYSIVAENIAYEYNSKGFRTRELARRFVEGWKKSPGHRKNMLDPDVDEIGVGVAQSKKTGRYYAVQDFARPRSEEVTFTISNRTDATISYQVDGKEFTLRSGYTVTQRRSRPPKLTFSTGKYKEASVYHPSNGEHYTVRQGPSGRLTIEEE